MPLPRTITDAPVKTFIAGRLIDGTGTRARSAVRILVKNGFIEAILEPQSAENPQGQVIDLSDFTIMPPLVDSHVHLSMSGTSDERVRHWQLEAPFADIKAVLEKHLCDHFACGVLAVRDGGDHAAHTLFFGRHLLPASFPIRVRAAGQAWHAPGRYGGLIGHTPAAGQTLLEGLQEECTLPDHIKIIQSGLNSLKEFGVETGPQFRSDDLRAAVAFAHRRGLPVMVHANGRRPVKLALEAGCDSIEHGFFMGDENLHRMAELGITWVPTAVTMQAYSLVLGAGDPRRDVCLRNLEHQLGQIERAARYGVRMAAGSDAGSQGVHHGKGLLDELQLLNRAGLNLEKAVQCATSNGAALLGLKEPPATLRAGMPATFLAVRRTMQDLIAALAEGADIYIRGQISGVLGKQA